MFPKLHFILIFSSLELIFGIRNGLRNYPETNLGADGFIGKDEFDRFKRAVFEEFEQMKEREEKLKDDMKRLKTENAEKDKKINGLERQLANLEKKQQNGMTRSMPYYETIGFTAYLDHGVHNLTQDRPVIYNKVLLNDGSGYNASTGMFTAPVSGVYLFSYSVGAKLLPNVHLSQYDVFTRLVVGGVHQLSAVAESTNTYDDEQGSTTAIVYVDEGTKVWTKHEFRGGNNLYSAEDERVTSFTGTLLYEREDSFTSSILG